jgi:hypothetical protein
LLPFSNLGCFYRHKIDHSLFGLLFASFTLVEREEYWQTERLQTERSWFKMRLGNFAPVSKQLTLKPDEMRTDPQLTPSSNKTNALGAGQERSSARGRTKFQSGLKPELAR